MAGIDRHRRSFIVKMNGITLSGRSTEKNGMKKAQQLAEIPNSCVVIVEQVRTISLPWCFIGRLEDGIKVVMDKILYRYRNKLAGVPIARGKHKLERNYAIAVEDQPQLHVPVRCKFAVFRPRIGSKLPARVVRVDEGQIVCSIYGVITANVWRHHGRKSKRKHEVNVGDQVRLKITKIRLHGRFLQLDAELRNGGSPAQ